MSIGHSLLGDRVYGYRPLTNLPTEPDRVMLHAARLAFDHPISKEKLDITAPLPGDFIPFVEAERLD